MRKYPKLDMVIVQVWIMQSMKINILKMAITKTFFGDEFDQPTETLKYDNR